METYHDNSISHFFKAARDFMITVAKYPVKWCPIDDSLLKHAKWIDFTSKFNHNFESVEYFVETFPVFNAIDKEKLQ